MLDQEQLRDTGPTASFTRDVLAQGAGAGSGTPLEGDLIVPRRSQLDGSPHRPGRALGRPATPASRPNVCAATAARVHVSELRGSHHGSRARASRVYAI